MPSQASGLPPNFSILSGCGETLMETYVDYQDQALLDLVLDLPEEFWRAALATGWQIP